MLLLSRQTRLRGGREMKNYTFAVSFIGECCQKAHLLVQTVRAPSQLKAKVQMLRDLKDMDIEADEICCTSEDAKVEEVEP